MTSIEMPVAKAPSLQQISLLFGEFWYELQPLGPIAVSNMIGQMVAPHENDFEPVLRVLPTFCKRLIETACPDVRSASDLPLPMRAELLGRVVRLVMERHSQHDVISAVAAVLMSAAPAQKGGLN